MGLLKKLFGAIFGFFSWLLSLVGGGKKSEYFLEIDESQAAPAPKTEAKPEPASSQSAPTEAKQNASSQPAANPQPQAVMPTVPAAGAPQNGAKPADSQPTQAPQPVATTSPSASSNNSATNSDRTFAPQYLNPVKNQSERRRPGANMGAFMSMAKEVKPSS